MIKTKIVIVVILVLSSLYAAACKAKNEGSFGGKAELEITSYATGKFAQSKVAAENVTAKLEPNGSHALSYILSFDDNSPIKCKLEVTDRDFEDDDTMNVKLSVNPEQTCEVKDQNGNMLTAKIVEVSGRILTYEKSPASLEIRLNGEKETGYRFSFSGFRK